MHVITGGAHNGKSAWVRKHYELNNDQQYAWISAYKEEQLPTDLTVMDKEIIVLEGVEQWVLDWVKRNSSIDYREKGKQFIRNWLDWEQKGIGRNLVVIGVDISKGIVPMDGQIRLWRDITGWFYQDLVESSHRFDFVWYGINKKLK